MDAVAVVVTAIWAMLPAYIPNNVAVLVGGGPPVDGGRTWRSRRLLGDGKTWRGSGGGFLAGIGVAVVLDAWHEGIGAVIGVGLPAFPLAVVVALPLGSVLGDMVASGVKRRFGRDRGSSVPVLDQLDFVVGALVLTAVIAPSWTVSVVTLPVFVAIVVVTPVLHVATNAGAYVLGLKDVPW